MLMYNLHNKFILTNPYEKLLIKSQLYTYHNEPTLILNEI